MGSRSKDIYNDNDNDNNDNDDHDVWPNNDNIDVLGVEKPHQSIPNLVVKLYCGDNIVGDVLTPRTPTYQTMNKEMNERKAYK
jgi:hypothetical protein